MHDSKFLSVPYTVDSAYYVILLGRYKYYDNQNITIKKMIFVAIQNNISKLDINTDAIYDYSNKIKYHYLVVDIL